VVNRCFQGAHTRQLGKARWRGANWMGNGPGRHLIQAPPATPNTTPTTQFPDKSTCQSEALHSVPQVQHVGVPAGMHPS
jgi:hypothetical protein